MNLSGKQKKGIVLLVLIVILNSCGVYSLPSQDDITPIVVNTFSSFPSPLPSATYPSTSTPILESTNIAVPISTNSGISTLTPTLLPEIENPPARNPKIEFPSNLILDEWLLDENSGFSRLSFTPKHGTGEQVIKLYESLDSFDVYPSPLVQGQYGKVLLNGHELATKEEIINSKSTIHVLYNGKEISQIDAGYAFTNPNVWGLWTYQDQWILEYVSVFKDSYDRFYNLGNIVWNGESLNHKFSYQESFGLTAIDGRILYFFRKDDRIGISYDGTEYDLGYEAVPHYRCCEIGPYENPASIGTGWQLNGNLSFFAERNGSKYFVVIWAK